MLDLKWCVLPTGPAPTQASSNLFNTRITYGKTENKGFSGAFGVNYNITEGVANGLVRQATYNFNCFGIDIGYNRFNLGPLRDENQFRIAISFSNVGAFSNLRTRDRLYQQGKNASGFWLFASGFLLLASGFLLLTNI